MAFDEVKVGPTTQKYSSVKNLGKQVNMSMLLAFPHFPGHIQ